MRRYNNVFISVIEHMLGNMLFYHESYESICKDILRLGSTIAMTVRGRITVVSTLVV